ncbi:DUF1206 domain-containing protein [Gaopeijia maritima]|uniref:DUF1206 domain-containing protein n=1 Tax=Gaopeijia maritima TaxID=3119007 RepID=UPI003249D3F0
MSPRRWSAHTVEWAARAGYAAKGLVYLGVGGITASTALRDGSGDAEGSRGALSQALGGPLGTALLIAVAAGIAGYVAWRLVQALLDPEDRGTDARALATRAVLLISGLLYASLGLWVVRVLLGRASRSGGEGGGGADTASAWLLQQPYGRWLLAAAGLAVMGYGVGEWVKAVRRSFEKRMRSDLNGSTRRWVVRCARFGLASRGIVFLTTGTFLIVAAWTADPDEARGLEGSLEALGDTPWGPWVMGLVALGLAAYGALQLIKARYRRIEAPSD